MTALSHDGRFDRRHVAAPSLSRARRGWGASRPYLLLALPIVLFAVALVLAAMAARRQAIDATIHALKTNHDAPVAIDGRPALLLARIEFLIGHDRVDETPPYVESLDRRGSDAERAIAHYDFANGRLRQGLDLLSANQLDKAGPYIILARQEYRQALEFQPDDWDAKFNLDVASRLIRDFPSFERTMGDTVKIDRKKIWTDIPGKPEGLP